MPDSTLRAYTTARSEPTLDRLLAIARTGNVSLDWLATGEEDEATAVREPSRAYDTRIPIAGEVPAGQLVERYVAEHPDEFIPTRQADGTVMGEMLFGLRLTGRSMEPWMYAGDVAVCSTVATVDPGDDVAVYLGETGESTIKRLTSRKGRTVQLTPLNPSPEFRPFRIELGPSDRIYRVKYVWRDVQKPREP